jgi:hypothetical protein
MPSTHLSLHYHIVFSTKDRHPFIADDWRGRLHEYLGGLVRAADGIPGAASGFSALLSDKNQFTNAKPKPITTKTGAGDPFPLNF